MEQKAFELIVKKTGEALEARGFAKDGEETQKDGARQVVFQSESLAYTITFTRAKKCFELAVCGVEEGKRSEEWKTISNWLFDPNESELSDAESIANDFLETVEGPARTIQPSRKKRSKEEESTADPLFFFNRLAGVFPELKEAIVQERTVYGRIRTITFANEKVMPYVKQVASASGNQGQRQKMCEIFNNLYASGDLDVRSTITIVLLNSVDDHDAQENLVPLFTDDLKKGYKAGVRMRGKKIKPEKKKKQSKFTADTLNDMR